MPTPDPMPPRSDLIVLPTLERLPAAHGRGRPRIGMVLSVGLDKNAPFTAGQAAESPFLSRFLQPWNWRVSSTGSNLDQLLSIRQVQVYFETADGTWQDAGTVPVERARAIDLQGLDELRERLAERFCLFAEQAGRGADGGTRNPWRWPVETPVDPDCRPWPGLLAHLAHLPWPLPQALGLCWLFDQPACVPEKTRFAAAPVLRISRRPHPSDRPHPGAERWLYPQTPVLDIHLDGKEKTAFMSYGQVPVGKKLMSIAAQANLPPPECRKGCFFDMGSLWVTPGDGLGDGTAGDWRSGLEDRLTVRLDLARAVLDWLREPPDGEVGSVDRRNHYGEAAELVLRELRLHTLPALGGGFLGGRLLRRLAAAWSTPKQPFSIKAADALDAAASSWFHQARSEQSLAPWCRWVTCALDATGRAPAVVALVADKADEEADRTGREGAPGLTSRLTLVETVSQLDTLISQLASPDVILAVFRSAWERWWVDEGGRDAKAKEKELPDEAKTLAEAFVGKPPDPSLDLAHELLRAGVGSECNDLVQIVFGPRSPAQLSAQRDLLTEQLRCDKDRIAGWRELRKLDASWCDERACEIARVIFPDEAGGPAPRTTEGLTVQVDGLSLDREDDDLLEQIQGVALLMRRKGDPAWHCLNLARPWVGSKALCDSVLLPSRLAYQGGLSAPTLTYDNQPLSAAGPLAGPGVAGASIRPDPAAVATLDEPLVDFSHCEPSVGKLPELVFGGEYEVLPFLVSNAGVLPKELTCGDTALWGLQLPEQTNGAPLGHVRTFNYLREAPVGALRLAGQAPPESAGAGPDGPDVPYGLPPVPPGVAPRLRELRPQMLLPPRDPLLRHLGAETSGDSILAGTPLLLMGTANLPLRRGVEVRNRFSIALGSPTTDLRTWDRWVAPEAPRDRRRFIWRSFHQLAHHAATSSETRRVRLDAAAAGVFLDDPAVDGLWAELVSFSPTGETREWQGLEAKIGLKAGRGASTGPGKAQAVPISDEYSNWRQATPCLRSEQRSPIAVEGMVGGDGLLEVKVGGRSLSGCGRLYRLTVYAVLAEEAEKRFRRSEAVRTQVVGDRHLNLTSPWHLLIEVVQPLWLDPAERQPLRQALWRALTPDSSRAEKGSLEVALDLSADEFSLIHPLIDRADLMHQVWSWRGRPPADHPDLPARQAPRPGAPSAAGTAGTPGAPDAADEPGAPDAELRRYLGFEMAEFGERSDEERRQLPMKRTDRPDQGQPASFLYEEDLGAAVPGGDFRALHHRFSARIWSRYRGVLPEEQSFLDARDGTTATRWRRLFVPCRFRGVIPAPKVKLVLPLTQEDPAAPGRGPGLLVAVDGPWYEVGGLAEELAVEVMTVSAPDSHAGLYHQAGTDPIVTGGSAAEALELAPDTPGSMPDPDGSWSGALPVDGLDIDLSRMAGAVGHTRDRTTIAPRFLASSFLLAPPEIRACEEGRIGNSKPDLAWWFFKLRFARRLRTQGPDGSGPSDRLSDWSPPFWVQLLPALNRVEEDWFPGPLPKVTLEREGTLTCETLTPWPSRPPFYLYAVVTRELRDFAGRPNQEAYVGVWWPGGPGLLRTDDETAELALAPGPAQRLRLRWLEVQSPRQPEIECSDGFWQALFDAASYTSRPDAPGGEVHPDALRCRIVRISRFFSIHTGS